MRPRLTSAARPLGVTATTETPPSWPREPAPRRLVVDQARAVVGEGLRGHERGVAVCDPATLCASRAHAAARTADPRIAYPRTAARQARLERACLLASMMLAACSAAPPPPPAPPPAPTAPGLGALPTLVPEEANLIILARPDDIWTAGPLRRVASTMLDEARLETFRARTGIDPRTLDEMVFAITDEGRTVVARGPFDAPFAVLEAGERMAPVESATDVPLMRRAGFLGNRRVDVAAPADDTIVWVDGTPQLAAAILSAAQHPETDRPHPFRRQPVDVLQALVEDAAFALIVPAPLRLPPDTGIGLLLAREEALAVWVDVAEEQLRIHAELRGEFPDGAEENFRAFAAAMAQSDLGRALGALDALETLRIVVEEGRVAAHVDVDPALLARGLHVLLDAEMSELFDDLPDAAPEAPSQSPELTEPVDGGPAPMTP